VIAAHDYIGRGDYDLHIMAVLAVVALVLWLLTRRREA
jgi:hypothetical protein